MGGSTVLRTTLLLALTVTLGCGPAAKETAPNDEPGGLLVGDPAPAITQAHWVRGEPITGWQPGQVYVLDFWATWCPPCIRGFGHMQAIQDRWADDGVRVIGVAIWSGSSRPPEEVIDSRTDLIYAMAVDRDDTNAATFMDATRSSGLPNAMIIDRHGRLAWVGSPTEGLDETLEAVLAGHHDLEAARHADEVRHRAAVFLDKAAAAEKEGEFTAAIEAIEEAIAVDPDRFAVYRGWQYEIALLRMEDSERARQVAAALLESPQGKEPYALYVLAARIVHNHAQTPEHLVDLDLALQCAGSAVELASGRRHDYLALLASVHALRQELEEAIEFQREALEAAPQADRPGLTQTLEEYLRRAGQR